MTTALSYRLSRGVKTTISPPIPQAYKWAAQYIPTPTRPLLDMSQGVPGVRPPESLLKALGSAASAPSSCGYCDVNGEPALRQALAGELKSVYGKDADVTADDVALTAGSNMAFVAAVMSLADAGDEVILPVPWYFNHQMTLSLLGIKTVPLQTLPSDGFTPSVERCASLITPNTKAIALVTPNNPTGATYSPSLLSSFATLAREHNIALIIDETYRDFIISGPPHTLFSSNWRTHFIHLFSFSKSYCTPGHRLGAIIASPTLITQTRTVLDCLQICPPRPIQLALAPLLPSMRPFIGETAIAIRDRHILFRDSLPPRWKVGSQGGYFAFVRHPFKGVDATEVSMRLAKEVGVVTLPETFFYEERDGGAGGGADGGGGDGRWIRFSVANVDDDKVRKVCERLKESEGLFGWPIDSDVD